tara:strand:+ start:1774 stop:1896 length:123 start_codon:yes stop_codon:yes gene_type:complete
LNANTNRDNIHPEVRRIARHRLAAHLSAFNKQVNLPGNSW